MKYLSALSIFVVIILLSGCQEGKLAKVTNLLLENDIIISNITEVDSVIDYQDSHEFFIKSLNLSEANRNELEKVLNYANSLSDEEKSTDEFQDFMQKKKDELIGMLNDIKKLSDKSALCTFKNELEEKKHEFLGWKATDEKADSVYIYYFDKEISEIQGIEKKEIR